MSQDKLSFQRAILKQKKPSLVTKLHERPRRIPPLNRPRFVGVPAGVMHQADTLFLPEDPHTKSKYLLVVVDVGSGYTWAKPMKRVSDALDALKSIYSNAAKPRVLGVDAGSEFKGETLKYLKRQGIAVRVAQTGRHSQQAMVERRNRAIGGALIKLQIARERFTGETNREWEADLPRVLKWINKLAKRRAEIKRKALAKEPGLPRATGIAKRLLDEGTEVRVALDFPKDVHGKRLHGSFRAGDVRWSEPVLIHNVILNRNQPPMYQVRTKGGKVIPSAYVRERLQVVGKEKMPKRKHVFREPPKPAPVPKRTAAPKTAEAAQTFVGKRFTYKGVEMVVTADRGGFIYGENVKKRGKPRIPRDDFLLKAIPL